FFVFFFLSSRRRHTRSKRDWSSDVCSSDLFNPQIFERFADYPQVEYILASEVRHKVKRCGLSEKESGRVTFLKPHQSWQTKDGCGEDIRLYTCHSTDCGVAFLAEYQGKKI